MPTSADFSADRIDRQDAAHIVNLGVYPIPAAGIFRLALPDFTQGPRGPVLLMEHTGIVAVKSGERMVSRAVIIVTLSE